jgi:hypothetical protein
MDFQVYLAVDYEAGLIKLADVRQNAITPSPARFPSADADCKSAGFSAGSIAAIVLGVVVGISLMIVAGYYLRRRRARQRHQSEKITQHSVSLPEPRASVAESSPMIGAPLSPELSGEGRTHELPSPNGGYPPPSPHAPAQPLHVPTTPNNSSTPYATAMPPVSPQVLANNPWNR